MAKQTGILPIEGTIGNLTFFKSKDGYLVKSKSGVTGDKIATDDAFQRTRENNAEFGRAGSASKLVRDSLRTIISGAKDSRMVSRLTAVMLKVVQADETNDRGQRNVIDGEAALLQGFDFNIGAKLSTTLYAPYTVSFDRSSGKAAINLAAFTPKVGITAPAGATHFRLFMGIAAVDFEAGSYEANGDTTDTLPYDNNVVADGIALTAAVTADSKHPVLIALGIEFLQQVNKKMYSLNNGAFNACMMVNVSTVD